MRTEPSHLAKCIAGVAAKFSTGALGKIKRAFDVWGCVLCNPLCVQFISCLQCVPRILAYDLASVCFSMMIPSDVYWLHFNDKFESVSY